MVPDRCIDQQAWCRFLDEQNDAGAFVRPRLRLFNDAMRGAFVILFALIRALLFPYIIFSQACDAPRA